MGTGVRPKQPAVLGVVVENLFDECDPTPRIRDIRTPISRPTDPVTSKKSDEEMTESGERQRMMGIALEGLIKHPDLTAKELEAKLGYSDGQIRKRLNDLRTAGLAINPTTKQCSISKKAAQTWRAVQK